MTTLILALPNTMPTAATEFEYVLSVDGRSATDHGSAPMSLLPRADDLVLVAPAQALSWHSVRLPPLAAGRLRSALDGLLEERLLDDPAKLAFALGPRRLANGDALVAAFDKTWLRASLELFEQGGRSASRVVPEFAPQAPGGPATRLHVIGADKDAVLVVVQEDGVSCLPLSSAHAAFAGKLIPDGDGEVLAEPSVTDLAEQLLGRPTVVQPAAMRLLDAGGGDWELAQFDLSITGGGRIARRWQHLARQLWQAPAWRAARWGLASLVLVNLVGLNAWAWTQEAVLRDKQQRVNSLFIEAFPGVRTIVDAPLQMQRELALLRQSSGSIAAEDMEAMLAALGASLPPGVHAGAIDFTSGEMSVKGLGVAGSGLDLVRDKLSARGYVARVDGDRVVVRSEGKP